MNKLLYIIYFCLGYSVVVNSTDLDVNRNEYCNGEYFNPTCPTGEIIMMTSALYGRMSIGRCLPIDRGEMGCQADVLQRFDSECSGKKSCNILVTDPTIQANGGCGSGLLLYLLASYKCVKETDLSTCNNDIVTVNSKNSYLPSSTIHNLCGNNNEQLTLKVASGQRMNISLINFEHADTYNGDVFGTLLDPDNNKRVVFGGRAREKQLMTSSSSSIEIAHQNKHKRFLLHVQVFGCRKMDPPSGAWMTRDGNVIEIGCHDSGKTWTMTCENNQWIGAVGQCGIQHDAGRNNVRSIETEENTKSISINTTLFGASSVVILIIFLSGVCILRRNIGNHKEHMTYAPPPYRTMQVSTLKDPINTQTLPMSKNDTETIAHRNDTYVNTNVSTSSGSVTYFVLENNDNKNI